MSCTATLTQRHTISLMAYLSSSRLTSLADLRKSMAASVTEREVMRVKSRRAGRLARTSPLQQIQNKQGTMVVLRALLLAALAITLLAVCSTSDASVRPVRSAGGIRGRSSGFDARSAPAATESLSGTSSSSLASAASEVVSALIKVWPHPVAQLWHATDSVRRNLQDQVDLPPPEADLNGVCSGDSLEEDPSACVAACAPAQCCQAETCPLMSCLPYMPCLALAEMMGVEVPPELAQNGNGDTSDGDGDGDATGTETDGDTDGDGTDGSGTDGDEPTGDGTFDEPEDGSLMDKLNDAADTLKDTYQTAMSDPSALTTGQKVGIGIGCFVALMMLVCLIKCCCCKKKGA